ncbi:ABC transporter ATP-binding protein [Bacillus toyonensis]|uniref:ABC transporter ATP-binding protein n=1 Tax=Bacillus toyonensis TaxID=155322 RepID=UPI000BFDCEAB|nr:ABC transporter ATP-binding protein [Bacillus toyonensis]PHB15964.1 multidrug ABC transporter permease [Bacillus toyonensis]
MKSGKESWIKKVWNITNPSKSYFILGLFLSIVSGLFSLVIPLLIRDIMDQFSKGVSFELLSKLFFFLILGMVFTSFSLYLLSKVGEEIVKNLRDKLWSKLLKLPINYYNKNKSGEMVSRITNDTTVIVNVMTHEIIDLITNCITLILSIIILFTLDIPMTLVLISVVPITLFVVMPLGKRIHDVSFQEQTTMSQLTAYLSQRLSEIKFIKAYNNQLKEIENGKGYFLFLLKCRLKKAKINSILIPIVGLFTHVILIGVIGFGAWRVDQGLISSGELVAFLLYLFQIITPFVQMNHFITSLQEAKGAMKRLFEILEEQEEQEEQIEIVTQNNIILPTELEFKNVSFGYNENQTILKDVSFKIKKGSLTALVGPSGSGKSTIFSLIERFYNPINGDILLGNQSYKYINLNNWRENFSYVSQDTSIFPGTVKENILYGVNKTITDNEVIEISKLANAHEFIMNFPDGYNTQVGERGNQLSGGQKQRIAIARALIRNTNFLLLDEATANLDSESEKQIQESINSLINKQTTFVIAHRLSTIIKADQIIVLENGNITGIGNHNELMNKNKYYQNVIKQQFDSKYMENELIKFPILNN